MSTAIAQRRARFTPDQTQEINRLLSMLQTDGKSFSVPVDRDWLLQDGHCKYFMLHYFPRDFSFKGKPSWEPVNTKLINFLEYEDEGVAWLPGGAGKSTTVSRWIIYTLCREPQIAFIYVEKSEPIARSRCRAIMEQLEGNEQLVHDFGDFKGPEWSALAFTIKQRPHISDWPTLRVFGTGGSALGSRCNIILVDDPVTTHNSNSEAERATIFQWYTEAASTCPYPLPLGQPNSHYLRKSFLIGTTFHLDDLYHQVLKRNPDIPHLHIKAVDMATGDSFSRRFIYRDMLELETSAEDSLIDAELLADVQHKHVFNLHTYRTTKGSAAFYRRYQNEPQNEDEAKFPELWFVGGEDNLAPAGGYPGCIDDSLELGLPSTEGWRYVTGVDPASGNKSSQTARFACVTLGADPKQPDETYLMDIAYGNYPLESDNENRTTQLGVILNHAKRYGSTVALETNNTQLVYAGAIRAEAKRRGIIVSIRGHWTTKGRKLDPEFGIEAMAPMIENGKLHLPWAEPSDRRAMQDLIDEFHFWRVYPTKDLVMAFWFAWRVLQRGLKQATFARAQALPKPLWLNRGAEWDMPANWSDRQREAFLSGGPLPDEVEEDEEL